MTGTGPQKIKGIQNQEETSKMILIVILQARFRSYFYLDGCVVIVGGDERVSTLHQFVERVAGANNRVSSDA